MKIKRTVCRLLVIGAVPAAMMIGAAAPAVAHDGGFDRSSACRDQDRDGYWAQYRHHWASYEEYRAYLSTSCVDNDDDRVKRLDHDNDKVEIKPPRHDDRDDVDKDREAGRGDRDEAQKDDGRGGPDDRDAGMGDGATDGQEGSPPVADDLG